MSDLTNDPSKLWQIIVVAASATPIIIILIKWFWKVTHNEVKSAIISDLKEDNEVFKKLMQEQMAVVKDTVFIMKKDNELNHKHSEKMIDVMMMHIDELKHVKSAVDNHEERIYKIEKSK
jgi:hypothetical protein